jgi:hypothetical protein
MVVRIMDDDCAGSCRAATRPIGTAAPARPAHTIEITTDSAMTAESPIDRRQMYTASAVVAATPTLLTNATRVSFDSTRLQWRRRIQ